MRNSLTPLDVADMLQDAEAIAAYLQAAEETGDAEYIAQARQTAHRAQERAGRAAQPHNGN